MGTGARGEGYLDAANGQHAILFTNRALAEAERVLGMSVLEIARNGNNLSINAVAQLTRIGLDAARKDRREARANYTLDDAFALLDELGFQVVATVVAEALAAVLTYKRSEQSDPPA